MYDIALVSGGAKTLRHKALNATKAEQLKNGIPLTSNLSYSASSIISIGLEDKSKEVTEPITLSYSLLKPIYYGLKQSYEDELTNIQDTERSLSGLQPLEFEDYRISQSDENTLPVMQNILSFLKAREAYVQGEVSKISTWQAEYNNTFGYGVQFTINTGILSPDVAKINFYSSTNGKEAIIAPASTQNVMPVFTQQGTNFFGWSFADWTLAKEHTEKLSYNEHILSNRDFNFFLVLHRPNIVFWVTVEDEAGREYTADAKMIQLYGLVSGMVISSANAGDVDFPDKEFFTVRDDYGLEYTAAASDFSKVNIDDRVMISKNDCTIHYETKKGEKTVKIINNEGICGTAVIGKMTEEKKYYSEIYSYPGTVQNGDDQSIYYAISHSGYYKIDTPLDNVMGTWLSKHPSEVSSKIKILVCQSITGKDIFSGGTSTAGATILLEYPNQYTLDTEIGRIVWKDFMTATDKATWSSLYENTITLSTGSSEEKFCVAYAQWVEFARGTVNESRGEVNNFIANMFLHDDASTSKNTRYSTVVWKEL